MPNDRRAIGARRRPTVGVFGLAVALATSLVLAAEPFASASSPAPVASASSPAPTTDNGFTTILDGTLSGGPASFDKWFQSGPGSFVPYGDGQGFMSTGGLGMLWYPQDFGNVIFRVDYRDVRTDTTGYSNGGVMIGFPAEQLCTPVYPTTPACTSQVPSQDRPSTWTYDWTGLPGPFPPAQTYSNDPSLGDPASGNGHACGQISTARSNPAWVAVYCGNEVQVNDSPDPPVFSGDPIKTGAVYNMRDLDATTGFGGSGAQARLDADVANGWVPGTPRAWHELEIQKIGQQLTVFIDGVLVNQYDNAIPLQPKRAVDPPSSAREFARTAIGLQNHGGSDHVEYKDVRVKEVGNPPRNVVAPQIAGSGALGQQLVVTPGEWENVTGRHDAHLTYQWFRSNNASQTPGDLPPTEVQYDNQLVGTGRTYSPTQADMAPGKVLWCRVSASTDQGTVYAYAEATNLH